MPYIDRNLVVVGDYFEKSKGLPIDYKVLGEKLEIESISTRIARFLSSYWLFSFLENYYVEEVKSVVHQFRDVFTEDARKVLSEGVYCRELQQRPSFEFDTLSYHRVKRLIYLDLNVNKALKDIKEIERWTDYEKATVKKHLFVSDKEISPLDIPNELKRIYKELNLRSSKTLNFTNESEKIVLDQLIETGKQLEELSFGNSKLSLDMLSALLDFFPNLKKIQLPKEWLILTNEGNIQSKLKKFFKKLAKNNKIEELSIPSSCASNDKSFYFSSLSLLKSLKKLEVGEANETNLSIIAKLENLESLTIQNEITKFVSHLDILKDSPKLETLVIDSASYRGVLVTLGKKLAQLESLKHLSLVADHRLGMPPKSDKDEDFDSFIYEISNLKNLETLQLQMRLEIFMLGNVSQNLCRFRKLKVLDLEYNSVRFEDKRIFYNDVTNPLKIEVVKLGGNRFETQNLINFITLFNRMPDLTYLDLRCTNSELDDRATLLKTLMDNLYYVPKLETLYINRHTFENADVARYFVNKLSKLPNLKFISLAYCNLTAESLEILVKGLKECPHLKEIELDTRYLFAPGTTVSQNSLRQLEELKVFIAARNS